MWFVCRIELHRQRSRRENSAKYITLNIEIQNHSENKLGSLQWPNLYQFCSENK